MLAAPLISSCDNQDVSLYCHMSSEGQSHTLPTLPLYLSINFKAMNKEQPLEQMKGKIIQNFADLVNFCINYRFKNTKINLW